jgi:hypothetical protein
MMGVGLEQLDGDQMLQPTLAHGGAVRLELGAVNSVDRLGEPLGWSQIESDAMASQVSP